MHGRAIQHKHSPTLQFELIGKGNHIYNYEHVTTPTHVMRGYKPLQMYGFPIQRMGYTVEPLLTDTTGTKDFVLYSEVSFAQELVGDHAPLIILFHYDGASLWTMKLIVLIRDLSIFSS